MLLRACVSIIGLAMMLALLVFAGCTAIMQPLSEWGQSRSAVAVAHEQTLQTEIEWDAYVQTEEIRAEQTEIEWDAYVQTEEIQSRSAVVVAHEQTLQTEIEWDAKVQIESGRADASKKTSFEYVMFYAIRFGIWLIVLLLLVLVARLAWNKYIESVEAQSL